MSNTLVVIGWLGLRTAYLNVPEEEAVERYMKENDLTPEDMKQVDKQVFTFQNSFGVYDAWSTGK